MKNNNELANEIEEAGHQPHCLYSLKCFDEFGGCQNCRRYDGVQIEDYNKNSILEPIGFYKPEHASIKDAYYK